MKRTLFFLISACILALGGSLASAQIKLPNIGELTNQTPIYIKTYPQDPAPLQPVTVEIESYLTDLNRAKISWLVNGKTAAAGTGMTSFQTTAGDSGSSIAITAVITTQQGNQFEQTVTLKPAEIDLVVEAISYTPPFYKGKTVYPYQGDVTVIAIPNFIQGKTRLDPKKLVYAWKIDDNAISGASGYGRDSVVLHGSVIARPLNVSVSVSSEDGTVAGSGRTTITPQSPKVVFYEDSPLYGTLFNKSLAGSFVLAGDEVRIKAVPFFFSGSYPKDKSSVAYAWRMNNSNTNSSTDTILLRKARGASGNSVVSVKTTSLSKLLQYTTSNLTVNYESQ